MKLKPTLRYAEEPNLDELVIVKKANDWIVESRAVPVPKMLFGEFWSEGELAVLAAPSGTGKSLLAVQIAESIASGRSIDPLKMTEQPQKVLYLDFKLSNKQFEMRYAEEFDAEEGDFLKNHHKFSGNLTRIVINPKAKLPEGFRGFDELLPGLVERLAHKYKARVVIIDNITNLQRSIYGYREIFAIMSGLNALKRRLGISILVLARTSKHDASRPTAIGRSTTIFNRFVGSMFTIGQSKLDSSARYIKQIVTHNTERLYDESHVPSYRLTRLNGNFLGFEYQDFASESVHLGDARDRRDWPLIQKIKELTDDGLSIRDIAAELGLPKTTVHRLLQMWTAEGQEAAAEAVAAAASGDPQDLTVNPDHFPGREEYNHALDHPRFKNMFATEDDENYRLRREYGMIDNARTKAHKEYLAIGTAPTLAEMLAKMSAADKNETAKHAEMSVPGAVATGDPASDESAIRIPQSAIDADNDPTNPFPGTRRATDEYGREIFIEKEDKRGKRQSWFNYDSNGNKQRNVRDCLGTIQITKIE